MGLSYRRLSGKFCIIGESRIRFVITQQIMNILVLAPHPDDETLGVGGAIAKHVAAGDHVSVAVLTGHGDSPHPLWPKDRWEEVRAECKLACDVLGAHQLLSMNG